MNFKRLGVRLIGVTIILYALLNLIFGNIGPGTDILNNLISFFILISGVGILILKHWSWYSTAAFLSE